MEDEYLQLVSGKVKAGQWSLVRPVQAKNSSGANVGPQTDNFDIDSPGQSDDLNVSVDLSGTNTAKLVFDIAYAPYGKQFSDTLDGDLGFYRLRAIIH